MIKNLFNHATQRAMIENGSPMPYAGASQFRLLAKYGDTVMGGRFLSDAYREFATWSVSNSGKGLTDGKYFLDYDDAKRDFMRRTALSQAPDVLTAMEIEAYDAQNNDTQDSNAQNSNTQNDDWEMGER